MAEPNARDAKLIQYLNEAYGKEKELEVALQAHIAMTTGRPTRSASRSTSRRPRRTAARWPSASSSSAARPRP